MPRVRASNRAPVPAKASTTIVRTSNHNAMRKHAMTTDGVSGSRTFMDSTLTVMVCPAKGCQTDPVAELLSLLQPKVGPTNRHALVGKLLAMDVECTLSVNL